MTKDRILKKMKNDPEGFSEMVLRLAKESIWLCDRYPTYRDNPTTEEIDGWLEMKKAANSILHNKLNT